MCVKMTVTKITTDASKDAATPIMTPIVLLAERSRSSLSLAASAAHFGMES